MTIDRLRAHWGLTRMPFAKDLAPSMLYAHRAHGEAAARISWCVEERAMGLITGEVGAGKSVAVRAALAGLDASRHTVIYLGNPSVGTRGLYSMIVATLGGTPRFHRASLIPQAAEALATEEDERGPVKAWCPAEGGDDGGVEAAGPDGGVAEVDDGVAAGVEASEGGAHGDGLAGADLAGDEADGPLLHAP